MSAINLGSLDIIGEIAGAPIDEEVEAFFDCKLEESDKARLSKLQKKFVDMYLLVFMSSFTEQFADCLRVNLPGDFEAPNEDWHIRRCTQWLSTMHNSPLFVRWHDFAHMALAVRQGHGRPHFVCGSTKPDDFILGRAWELNGHLGQMPNYQLDAWGDEFYIGAFAVPSFSEREDGEVEMGRRWIWKDALFASNSPDQADRMKLLVEEAGVDLTVHRRFIGADLRLRQNSKPSLDELYDYYRAKLAIYSMRTAVAELEAAEQRGAFELFVGEDFDAYWENESLALFEKKTTPLLRLLSKLDDEFLDKEAVFLWRNKRFLERLLKAKAGSSAERNPRVLLDIFMEWALLRS